MVSCRTAKTPDCKCNPFSHDNNANLQLSSSSELFIDVLLPQAHIIEWADGSGDDEEQNDACSLDKQGLIG